MMTHLPDLIQEMRRPRLLVRAARLGAEDYRRDRHLPRLLGRGEQIGPLRALERLIAAEAPLDQARRAGEAGYSPARHVEMLAAIIGELQLARNAAPVPV